MSIEGQIRMAVRDAVNRPSRKPFHWGGLKGYQQLQAIAQALQEIPVDKAETTYLQQLAMQVGRAVEKNRTLAQDVQEAHTCLRDIAHCLRYPSASELDDDTTAPPLSSEQVKEEMEQLLEQFHPDFKRCPAQTALHDSWQRVWKTSGDDWLHCYDIPGLPPDNLKLEALFGRLRRHQRRVSGRKSTPELRDFGQCQVLFLAESEEDLLQQLRQVPLEEYQERRRRLAEAEAPRQLLYRLHRNPLRTMRDLINRHTTRRAELTSNTGLSPPGNPSPHPENAISEIVTPSYLHYQVSYPYY